MDQQQIEIITVNDRNSAAIEKPAGAAVDEAFNGHKGSKEADSGSQPQNLNYKSDEQEVLSDEPINPEEIRIHYLPQVQGLMPTRINVWKVAFEEISNQKKLLQKQFDKTEEEIRSVKNEIYQVIGFFSAFQGLLITAAAQSNLLRCNNVGFILALSAFATALAVFGIWQKIMAMEKLRFDNIRNDHSQKVVRDSLYKLKILAFKIAFDPYIHIGDAPRTRTGFAARKEIWLVVSVFAFGGLCIVAMRQIVCNPSHSLPSN
ncbi:hypothetical protein CY35_13G107900 [Sphagnum magellanicum]|nr:hypothetical protein CY35_13G107900 [Sphagnum magellanicum]KAH9544234.1 hypothetical protein CY35_13G107900 [Sphagnum magellanicum]